MICLVIDVVVLVGFLEVVKVTHVVLLVWLLACSNWVTQMATKSVFVYGVCSYRVTVTFSYHSGLTSLFYFAPIQTI